MRPQSITITPVAADADGICLSQTPGAAGNLTIAGALASGGVATISQPAHVSITAAADDSARTFTITGTDRNGRAQTEAITGPDTTTVNGTKNFATVTQVAVDAATAGAITVGNQDALESQWYPWDRFAAEMSQHVALSSSADFTWGIEHTLSDIQAAGFEETDADVFDDATMVAQTASLAGSTSAGVRASRVKLSSFVAGSATWHLLQTQA